MLESSSKWGSWASANSCPLRYARYVSKTKSWSAMFKNVWRWKRISRNISKKILTFSRWHQHLPRSFLRQKLSETIRNPAIAEFFSWCSAGSAAPRNRTYIINWIYVRCWRSRNQRAACCLSNGMQHRDHLTYHTLKCPSWVLKKKTLLFCGPFCWGNAACE